jgi:hypothetical protein
MSTRTWVVAAVASLAVACGGKSDGSGFGNDAGGRDGGGGLNDASLLHHDAMTLGNPDAGGQHGTLEVFPANPTLTVSNTAAMPTQAFKAKLTTGGVTSTVTASWTLDAFTLGTIGTSGVFASNGTIAGTATVSATYGSLKAKTTVKVLIHTSTNLGNVTLPDGTVIPQDSSMVTPADLTALTAVSTAGDAGVVGGDSGTPTKIIYPYDQTVIPLGLLAPVVQFSPGSIPPVDFKVSLDTTDFHWDGYGHVASPAQLQAAIPQSVWDGALESAQPSPKQAVVTLSITKAAAGVAYGPAQTHLIVAPGKLTGVIYFESYSSDAIDAGTAGATDFGLWAVKPGASTPPSHVQTGCVICHGVSASGNTLTTGTDDPTIGQNTGVFRIESDGGYTQLATAPTTFPYLIGGGVDSRGIGWGTVSPDGKVLLRGINQFWGGQSLTAWAVPSQPLLAGGVVQPLSTSMTVDGNFNMFVPQYSVDGKKLVYVTAANTGDAGSTGTISQSIGIVDIATALGDGGAGGFGSVTLSNPHMVYDATGAGADAGSGAYTKVPVFLPDSASVVFEETHDSYTGYDHMLPDYLGQAAVTDPGVDGELAMLQPETGGGYVRVTLANANAGNDPASPTVNYEPKPLPVEVGGYYWVVFASRRVDAYPTVNAPKKLWVTAISPGGTPGMDPSHPPFTLVNQAIVAPQATQRAYWALSPCQGLGASCTTGVDCCNGSCVPGGMDAGGGLVCGKPPAAACANVGEQCKAGQNSSCCGAAQGVTCIGTLNGYGVCNAPGAPP